jgi:FixJ family two-component response regulator
MDVLLPDQHGLDASAVHELRTPHTAIFQSMTFLPAGLAGPLTAGAVAFLHKPYDTEDLLGAIQVALAG